MCGIAGWLGNVPDGQQVVKRIIPLLRHRGPDAQDFRQWLGAALIHTRLSIIDLSPTGAQPMSNEDGTIWTVFNGEIYNHRELRHDLEARGHHFRGHSDTEVLPHLYEEEGADFVSRLRGMFAFAIYDSRTRTLLLARDRFGIKPLFYAPCKERLAFSSEINALRMVPDINLQPNPQAIADFAALFYIPAPETFYTGIKALQPSELLEAQFNGDGIEWRVRTYHRWTMAPNLSLTLKDAVNQADELVTSAVQRQLESDVPLGALLSGGIDSSLVSTAAQDDIRRTLRTFNVRFPDQEYDETWAALAVAKHIASQHLTLDMNQDGGMWKAVTGLLHHAGQPFADTSLFAVNAVCRLMRQHVTVALSGDGGDEGFGGYNFYRELAEIERLQRLPFFVWHSAPLMLKPLVKLGLIRDSLPQRVRNLTGADDTTIIQTLFCWIREEEHRQLCIQNDFLPVSRLFEKQWNYDLPSQAGRLQYLSAHATEVNTRLTLANDYLFKVDTASMRHSLEVRVPMLDEELFAFGLTLPHRLKVQGRTSKVVLRGVADRYLPAEVARKPKHGFSIPVDLWVDDNFKTKLQETLLAPASPLKEYFEPQVYQPWVQAFCKGRRHPSVSRQGIYQRVTMLLSLNLALS